MKKTLTRIVRELYYYQDNLKIIIDPKDVTTIPNFISGNMSDINGDVSDIRGNMDNIRGNVSNIRGDVSNIRGNVSDISGNVSNISGNMSDINGDIDSCDITEEERKKCVNIDELVLD